MPVCKHPVAAFALDTCKTGKALNECMSCRTPFRHRQFHLKNKTLAREILCLRHSTCWARSWVCEHPRDSRPGHLCNLTVACLSARKWTNEFVRFTRLCRSKTRSHRSHPRPKGGDPQVTLAREIFSKNWLTLLFDLLI